MIINGIDFKLTAIDKRKNQRHGLYINKERQISLLISQYNHEGDFESANEAVLAISKEAYLELGRAMKEDGQPMAINVSKVDGKTSDYKAIYGEYIDDLNENIKFFDEIKESLRGNPKGAEKYLFARYKR